MAKAKTLAVGYVLDESGSMESCRQSTIDGFNEYIGSLAKEKGKVGLSLTKFSRIAHGVLDANANTNYRVVYENEPVATVAKLSKETYVPDGGTPLYDAIGRTVKGLEAKLKGKKPDAVLFVIHTDGLENASVEYSQAAVVALIQAKEAEGWKFIYLGVTQDAITAERVSRSLGLQEDSSVSLAYADTKAAYRGVALASAGVMADPGMSAQNVAMTVNQTITEANEGTDTFVDDLTAAMVKPIEADSLKPGYLNQPKKSGK